MNNRTCLRTRYFNNGQQRLSASVAGSPDKPCVILLHGGGQTRHAWNTSAQNLLRAGYQVLSLDLRGHGESDWATNGDYSLDSQIGDLKAVIAQLPNPPILVGASLGGLIALACAGENPGIACALVLVDVTPKVDPEGEARVKQFMQANPDGFASFGEAAAVIARYLPHRPRRPSTKGLRNNLRFRNGRYYWHWDPRLFDTLDVSPQIAQARYDQAAASLKIPTLLIRGARSELVGSEHVEHFLTLMPHAQYLDVAGAGHMVSGDSNHVFSQALEQFLTTVAPPPDA
ncbi:alpha/beta fold hydrolase [Pseudomonas sp. LB3P14]